MRQTILDYINNEYATTEHKLITLRTALTGETSIEVIELIENAIIRLERDLARNLYEGDMIIVEVNGNLVKSYKMPKSFGEKTVEMYNDRIDNYTSKIEELDTMEIFHDGEVFYSFEELAEYLH